MTSNIDYNGLITAVGKCCLTEDACGGCTKENCLVGYSKKTLMDALKKQEEFVAGGMEALPYHDTKLYDEYTTSDTIGFLLKQCRNCSLYHDEECIINVIRSAMEISLFGEPQEYKGSALVYLSDIQKLNPTVAEKVAIAFRRK